MTRSDVPALPTKAEAAEWLRWAFQQVRLAAAAYQAAIRREWSQ